MKPGPITRKQFVGWFIVFGIGMGLWASPGNSLGGIGLGFLTCSNLILMPPQERSRPLVSRQVFWVFFAMAVFAALMFASKRWLPDDFLAPVGRVIRHPVLVGILWIIAVRFTYRRYSLAKTDAQNAA